jgi:hypothetical protein
METIPLFQDPMSPHNKDAMTTRSFAMEYAKMDLNLVWDPVLNQLVNQPLYIAMEHANQLIFLVA